MTNGQPAALTFSAAHGDTSRLYLLPLSGSHETEEMEVELHLAFATQPEELVEFCVEGEAVFVDALALESNPVFEKAGPAVSQGSWCS